MPHKADYVRAEAARNTTFDHHCHWTGCERKVPPAMWGCKAHWFKLPARLRAKIWRAYRPGQEVTKDPSAEYLIVAREVQDWIAAQAIEARRAETGTGSVHESAVGEADAPNLPIPSQDTPS